MLGLGILPISCPTGSEEAWPPNVFDVHRVSKNVPTLDRAKLTTLRVDSRQFSATSAVFNLPHLHFAPPLGVTPFEFRRDFRHQKTRVPCGVACVILYV